MLLSDKELYADSIQFSYENSKTLLTGAYLRCRIRDRIALLGRNGCGKSTLLKILFGSIRAQHAYIRLNGQRITKAFVSKDVCYLPQDSFLPTAIRVDQAVKLMIEDSKIREKITGDALLKPVAKELIANLAGGELRYLEIMLLVHQPATFMLLDEPFSGISPVVKENIAALIVSLSPQKGFIISDHDYQNVLEVSNQIVLLQNGGCRVLKDRRELEMFYVPEGTFDGR